MKSIDIVVPCYNEEDVLHMFFEETNKVINTFKDYIFNYIFVDDGSKDKTLSILMELSKSADNVKYISFSRNFGKEAGIYAGLKYSHGDYVVVMDADLQHPPTLFKPMIQALEEGYDCCAAMRSNREGESKIRSLFSRTFYKLSNSMTDVEMKQGAVDYRMMTRQMINSVLELSEVQRFSKGIFMWVGFNTKWIPYENVERPVGETKWSFWGLFKYAIDGITSFSVAPLRFVTGMGTLISIFAFLYIIFTLVQTLITGIDVPGYFTTLSAVLFLGGILEISIGILGEYIGHIYMEVKDRPIFILKNTNIDLIHHREMTSEKKV